MTDLPESGSLGVRKLQPSFQLGLQDAVFGCQILIPKQQLLVHRPGDVGQDARANSMCLPFPFARRSAIGALTRQKNVADDARRGYVSTG